MHLPGLLLVFRTNAAYGRFWEVRVGRGHDILPLPLPLPLTLSQARAQWGVVTTECRALASLACTYMCALAQPSTPSRTPNHLYP